MTASANVDVRVATPKDLQALGLLVRQSFESYLHPYMVAAQPGWTTFVRHILEHVDVHPQHQYALCEDERGEVTAFADFKTSGDVGFLSYIAVREDARRQGFARALLRSLVNRTGVTAVELDVFSDNEPALKMYSRLGFRTQTESEWRVSPLPVVNETQDSGVVRFTNLPMAMAAHAEFGFCELTGFHGEDAFRLGMIGTRTLRCFDAATFDDDSILAVVCREFSSLTHAFGVFDQDEGAAQDSMVLKKSLRLRADDLSAFEGST